MLTLEELETRLEELRSKWRHWPKTRLDPRYPVFRVDESKALWLKLQIEKLKNQPPKAE